DGWWDEAEHNVTEAIFTPIGNAATGLAALLSGEIDMISPIPLQDVAQVEGREGFQVLGGLETRVIMLGFGHDREVLKYGADAGAPNPFLDQDGFVLVDASMVYTVDSGLFSIGLHGKNLFDKEYIVSGYNFVAGGTPPGTPFIPTLGLEGTLTGFYGDPRRIFVTAQVNF
ncbi:MAG: TonB-dependent receptor, partial [Porphyrobacter sp. HL-46]